VIYLILDTNIWIYLANGLNPDTSKHDGGDSFHFELLDKLKSNRDICILVNDIVFEEWRRNKEHSQLKIEKLKNKLKNPSAVFQEIKKYTKSGTGGLQQEYIEGIKKDIIANEEHIQKVEDFLFNNCKKINISKKLKIKTFDLSVLKKAPFHNSKNNIADAAILLSSADHLTKKMSWEREGWSAIFVSNNFSDFTDGKDKDNFHPDLKELIEESRIQYNRFLPKALDISEKIILQIEEHRKHEIWLESVSFYCQMPNCQDNEDFSPWGYLQNRMKVKHETDECNDPNQMTLFEENQQIKKEVITSGFGKCNICETLHVECPECGELTYTDDVIEDNIYEELGSVEFECAWCFTRLEIKHDDAEDERCLFVKKSLDEEE